MVLQRAGDDLARAGGAPVDQHDHRVAGLGILRVRALHLGVAAAAALGGDDHTLVEEAVGDLHRLLEQPAGIVAQVQHQAAELAASLVAQGIERPLEIDVGAILEGLDLHVAVAPVVQLLLDRDDADHVAHQREQPGLVPAVAPDLDQALGARWTHQRAHAFRLLPAARLEPIDLQQLVPGLDAGARGGRVPARRELQSHAPVLAVCLLLERGVRLGFHEGGVRIEGTHHAVDGPVQQLGLVHLLDEVVLDQAQHVAEDVQLAVGTARVARCLRHTGGEQPACRRADREQDEALPAAAPGRDVQGRRRRHQRHPTPV